jgi:diguanylate cyclase (GGDEF)-like protein/PAS domain S-box-containing protein
MDHPFLYIIAGIALILAMFGLIWALLIRRLNRKLIELNEELRNHRQVNDNTTDVTWHLDSEYRFTYVSQGDEGMRGFTPEEVLGTSLWDMLKPEGIEHMKQANAQRLAREAQGIKTDAIHYEVEQLCKDGSWMWTEATVTPLRDENGVLVGYRGVSRDINERKRIEKVLRDSEERYRCLVETAQESILVAQDGIMTYFNPSFSTMTGYKPAEIQDMPFLDYICPEDRDLVLANHKARLAGKEVGNRYQVRLLHNSGTLVWVELSAVKIVWNNHPATLCFLNDITERKIMEDALRQSENRYRCLIETAQEGILVAQDGVLAFVNPMMATVSGYTMEELNRRNFLDLIYAEDRDLVLANHKRRLAGEQLSNRYHVRIQNKSGGIVWVEMSGVLIDWNGRPATLAFVYDITERLAVEQKVKHMAQHDALTDLPNRALFSDRLQQAISLAKRDKRRLAVMFVDLDNFKPVNDNIGHDVGDLLLQAVAQRIRDVLRDSDTVARIGGDEFVVLVPSVKDGADAHMVANRIQTGLLQPFDIGGHTIRMTASTGIALFPDHGESEIELCKNADHAMYHVKSHGRDGIAIYCLDN